MSEFSNTKNEAKDLTEESLLDALVKPMEAKLPPDNPPVPLWLYERLMAGDPEAERIYAEGLLRYRFEI